MNKFFLLLFALSAVSFINSQKYTLDNYYEFFIGLLIYKIPYDCPAFFFNNKERILDLYYDAFNNIVKGTKMSEAYSNVGVQISEINGFNEACSEKLPLGDIVNLIRSGDISHKDKEIKEIIFGGETNKALGQIAMSARAYESFKDFGDELPAKKTFGRYLATFLTINEEDGDKVEMFKKFLNYYKSKK